MTSSISLLEVPTAWGIGELGWSRPKSALVFGIGAFLIGIFCLLGYNVLSDVRPLGFWSLFAETDILDTIDAFTGKIMLPLGALLTSLFIGWKADKNLLRTTAGLSPIAFGLWRFLIAWLCPIAVTIILVTGLFPSILGA